MSKIEVDKIDPQSGTDLELGTSGDTITIPAGVTFDSSAATNTLPSTVVTTTGSQTLTNKSIATTQLTGTITPSDSTVSLAKLTATGTKDATTFLRGDNTFAAAGLNGWSEDGANNNLLPASASAGIYLGVNTATASNLLDDYEEGTFTPIIEGGGLTPTYSHQSGAYTKIGNKVMVTFRIGISSAGQTANRLDFGGLPFTSFNGEFEGGAYFSYINSVFSSTINATILLYQPSNTTKFSAWKTNGSTFTGNDVNSTSGIDIYITGFYRAA